jgi:hypothetical protein
MTKKTGKDAKTSGGIPAGWRGIAGGIVAGVLYTCTAAVCWVVPMVPAVRVNLDAGAQQGNTWAYAAIAFVVAAAVFIEIAREAAAVSGRALYGFLAAFFLLMNVYNALGNVAAHSEHDRGDRKTAMAAFRRDADQSRQWQQSRQAQAAIAGDATSESIEADIQSTKAADATRWNATGGCDVAKITAGPSKAFCATLAALAAKKAAAVKRDELDTRLATLTGKDAAAVPESADPAAESVAHMLGLLGYTVTDDGKVLIASLRDWGKAIGVELLAAFGPSALLSLLRKIAAALLGTAFLGAMPVPQREARREMGKDKTVPSAPEAETPAEKPAVPVQDGDAEIDAFIIRRIEFVAGESVPAGDLFRAWQEDCEAHGVPAGTAKAFSLRIRKRVTHDPNNKKPVYRGVRLKAVRPLLRVVAN